MVFGAFEIFCVLQFFATQKTKHVLALDATTLDAPALVFVPQL